MKKHYNHLTCLLVVVIGLYPAWSTFAQTVEKQGVIKGKVLDKETRSPLAGVNVTLSGTQYGASTDTSGNFSIPQIPVGNYSVQCSYLGYETLTQTDVIVRPQRITYLEAVLPTSTFQGESVTISAGYFTEIDNRKVSTATFSNEEIRRSPGTAGDVSRILSVLPSITKANGFNNGLVVRGGSEIENAFYLDNIEIPNINHYPTQGATGGPIGLLNVDFIQNIEFSAGGFSPAYGDRLSSVMELTFREGNRDEFDGQLDMSFAGAGVSAEGPVDGGKGSWMVSVRRSFLELLTGAIGTGQVPWYSDYQGKLVYDLNPQHKIMVLGVAGVDAIKSEREDAADNGENAYGDFNTVESAVGVNWRALWGKHGYSETSASHLYTRYKFDFLETVSNNRLWSSKTPQQSWQFRNVNHVQLPDGSSVEFGVDGKYLADSYDYFYAAYTNEFGQSRPELQVDDRITSPKAGGFLNFTWALHPRVSVTIGGRGDYLEYSGNAHFSPRTSLALRLSEKTSLTGSWGVFHQHLPLYVMSQQAAFKELKDPVAYHTILGLSHLLREDTRLTVELYDKQYRQFPMDPSVPSLFMLDETLTQGWFMNHETLVDNGKAWSRGVETMVQKKLATQIYGIVSAAFFRTKYKGLDGVWRSRAFDNRWLVNLEGGYKPNRRWEFSARWLFAGGDPFTPLDMDASVALNRGVLDETRVMGARHSNYHSLNLRMDRRFHYGSKNMVLYFSVWNAYNRKNVAMTYWNEVESKPDELYQWSLLPIFGCEYEF